MDETIEWTGDEEMDRVLTQVHNSAIDTTLAHLPRFILDILYMSIEFKRNVEDFLEANPDLLDKKPQLANVLSQLEEIEHGLTQQQMLERAADTVRRMNNDRLQEDQRREPERSDAPRRRDAQRDLRPLGTSGPATLSLGSGPDASGTEGTG